MVLYSLEELLDFLFLNYVETVQLAIPLFKQCIFGFQHFNILLQLDLATLVVI